MKNYLVNYLENYWDNIFFEDFLGEYFVNYWGEITFNDLGWFGGLGGMDIIKPGTALTS